jgi:hypothetical protein
MKWLGDQNDCDHCFCVHGEDTVPKMTLDYGPATRDEVYQNHDDRDDQQDVNESADCVTGYHAEQP